MTPISSASHSIFPNQYKETSELKESLQRIINMETDPDKKKELSDIIRIIDDNKLNEDNFNWFFFKEKSDDSSDLSFIINYYICSISSPKGVFLKNDGTLPQLELLKWLAGLHVYADFVPEKKFVVLLDERCTPVLGNLTGNSEEEVLQIALTTLVYGMTRGSIINEVVAETICAILESDYFKGNETFKDVKKVVSNFDELDLKSYKTLKEALEKMESENGYCAEYPSDDSDSEEIEKFNSYERGQKRVLLNYAKTMQKRSKDNSPLRNLSWIHFDEEIPLGVSDDIEVINHKGLNNSLHKISKKFFFAFYRGIHYDIKRWSSKERRAHRNFNELGRALFSPAVYDLCGLQATRDYNVPTDGAKYQKLLKTAELLHHQMKTLDKLGVVRLEGNGHVESLIGKKGIAYRSPMAAIAEFYSSSYKNYHKALKLISKKIKSEEVFEHPLDVAFLFAKSKETPVVSTGMTPRAGGLYAVGDKFYQGQKNTRLRPRWWKGGKAERPYSGKMYTLILTIEDLLKLNPVHVSSLQDAGEIAVPENVLPEDEATFYSYIPARYLIYQKKVRYPSFNRDHSDLFFLKYGLSRSQFEKYRKRLLESQPHSQRNRKAKRDLANHIADHTHVSLVEDAKIKAEELGGWLVYLNKYRKISIMPPKLRPLSAKTKDQERLLAESNQRRSINTSKSKRQRLVPGKKDWLHTLMQKYNVQTGYTLADVLKKLLKKYQDKLNVLFSCKICNINMALEEIVDLVEPLPETVAKHFLKQYAFLQSVSDLCKIRIFVKSPLFNQDLVIKSDSQEKIELIYLGGNAFFGLIPKS